jgi:hypothetical protein
MFSNLLSLDVIGLCANLTIIVIDSNKHKEVLARRGPGAQSLLDLLQAVRSWTPYFASFTDISKFDKRLDFYMNPMYKSRHVKTLMKLSRASGLYPECLILKGVDMEEIPVAQGSYGDVHKGLLQGKKIAVKVLRIYQDSNRDKLLKVSN